MRERIERLLLGGTQANAWGVDAGLALLRVGAGLALCTIFEKFLPRAGVWGPQEWFVNDVAKMGFPFPAAFAYHKDIGRDGVAALAFFLITASLTLTGPGRFSLDSWLAGRWRRRRGRG
jgi:hypothetical protein